ncbi:hypothetical protein RB195_017136 [Necator americanus]|uniref:Uncharacterized protein n=1 Tax=Necator americanus TaxID=51031 RepID=A0ABR1C3S4_NECAM
MTILFSQALSETLQERLNQLRENPRLKLLQDYPERSDAIAGPRSVSEFIIQENYTFTLLLLMFLKDCQKSIYYSFR